MVMNAAPVGIVAPTQPNQYVEKNKKDAQLLDARIQILDSKIETARKNGQNDVVQNLQMQRDALLYNLEAKKAGTVVKY
jgi:hypothetical protein